MKFFTNKKFLVKLIATLCICLAIMTSCLVPKVQADNEGGELVSKVGGVLLDPICALLLSLGDGVMETIQKATMGTASSTAIFDLTQSTWWKYVVAAIIAVVVIAACVFTFGWGTIIAAAIKLAIKGLLIYGVAQVITMGGAKAAVTSVVGQYFGSNVVLPMYTIGPEEIFSGEILLFDANVFNPKTVYVETSTGAVKTLTDWNAKQESGDETVYPNRADGETAEHYYFMRNGEKVTTSMNNAASELKDTIAKWYYVIRNIAIIGLMLVLVYVGTRMLLSSIASEKAKYKQMLGDWVIALCLVFLMHYIMVFANTFVEGVTNIFANVAEDNKYLVVIDDAPDKLQEGVKEINAEYVDEANDIISWPTNLMGKWRLEAQEKDGTAEYVGYTLCYVALVMYTLFFAFTYAKRLLYLLFLTVISPMVALTYPIDKINDGQAQAFNMWMKEYIINLLIQPFHLLLYIVFISMAFDLAGTNVIYSLVAIGFMIPAEKFLRSMFGFNKANSPGFLAGPAGAALTISAVQSLAKFAGKGHGGKGAGGNGKGSGEQDKNKIRKADSGRTADKLMDEAVTAGNESGNFLGGGSGDNGSPTGNNTPPTGRNPSQPNNNNAVDENERRRLLQDEPSEADLLREELDNADYNDMYLNPDVWQEKMDRLAELEAQEEPEPEPEPQPEPEQQPQQRQEPYRFKGGYLGARLSLWKDNNLNKKKLADLTISGVKKASSIGLGATGAMLGVAAGIASGSPGDAFKYGASAAYAGSAIGQGLANRAGERVQKEEQLHDEARQRQLGPDKYKEIKNKELDDAFMKDPETRKKYALRFGTKNKEETNAIMRQAIEYRQEGITDDEIIIKAMSIDKNNRTDKRSIAAAKLAMVSKSQKEFKDTMDRFKNRPGVENKHVRDMEARIKKINSSTLN